MPEPCLSNWPDYKELYKLLSRTVETPEEMILSNEECDLA